MPRTVSIRSLIEKYGYKDSRIKYKNIVKYEEALKKLGDYKNSNLKLKSIKNNFDMNEMSKNNCRCAACNKRIRFEYEIEDTKTGVSQVYGSNCAATVLNLSGMQVKDLNAYQEAIDDHEQLEEWKKNNQQVIKRLKIMKDCNELYYKAFWEEIEERPLLENDAKYILGADMDKIIKNGESRKAKAQKYEKPLLKLKKNIENHQNNKFLLSLQNQYENSLSFSINQLIAIDKIYYTDILNNVKDNLDYEYLLNCDTIILDQLNTRLNAHTNSEQLVKYVNQNYDVINDYYDKNGNTKDKYLWIAYKVKHDKFNAHEPNYAVENKKKGYYGKGKKQCTIKDTTIL